VGRRRTLPARDQKSTQTITANDLTLVSTQKLTVVVVIDKNDKARNMQNLNGADTYTFMPGDLPSNFGPGDVAKIQFLAREGTRINKSKSFWTKDRNTMIDGLASLGAPPIVIFGDGVAFALFTDPDPIPLVYSDILLYRDKDLANFNMDQFTTPTGQLVTGIPSSIVINPGDGVLLPFGPVLPDKYELALAQAAALSTSDDAYSVAAADTVPEPATLSLLFVGTLGLILIRRVFRARRPPRG
jgi:hypothetical protein